MEKLWSIAKSISQLKCELISGAGVSLNGRRSSLWQVFLYSHTEGVMPPKHVGKQHFPFLCERGGFRTFSSIKAHPRLPLTSTSSNGGKAPSCAQSRLDKIRLNVGSARHNSSRGRATTSARRHHLDNISIYVTWDGLSFFLSELLKGKLF